MKQRLIILASVFITAAVLFIVGGVSTSVMAQKTAAQSTTATDTVKAYQDRIAQYDQLLQEANQRLEKANADLVTMQNQVNQLSTQVSGPAANNAVSANTTAANGAARQVAVSAKQAEDIAQKATDGFLPPAKAAELVSFKGQAAYEVTFAKGAVYVDANSGQVLFNGTVPQQITSVTAAKIASDYMKDADILQVDQVSIAKMTLWRVIFHSGNMVYIQPDGQILYVNMKDTTVTLNKGGSGGSSSGSGGTTTNPSHGVDHSDSESGDH